MIADHIIAVHTPRDPGWIQPGSEQHRRMITPSKVGAIHRLSRWESQFSLWHRMRGDLPPEEPKDAFALGHDVEELAARRFRRRYPNRRISRTEVQFVIDPAHFGFPAAVTIDRRQTFGSANAVLETKLARDQNDLDKWGDDLTGDLPPDYWLQLLMQMVFTGWTKHPGNLLCLGPYYNERIYELVYDHDARVEAAAAIEVCREFYNSLDGDEPPDLDASPATYTTLKQLHPEIDGTTVEIDAEQAIAYASARSAFAAAEESLQLESNHLLKRMEQAQYAEFNGLQLARRQRGGKGGVSFYPSKTVTPDKILAATASTGGNPA